MKLNESIELKNMKMEMNNQHMRSIMEEMASNEEMRSCMHEVLTMEGFLPETLSEGESYDEFMSAMMEDDEIMSEMYKACSMNESDCGTKMESWLNEKLIGGQKELDKNNNGEVDAADFVALRKEKGIHEIELTEYDKEVMSKFQNQYGKKRGKSIYYVTANKQDRSPESFEKNEGDIYEGNYPEGEHYQVKISQICDDLADVNRMMGDNDELPAWIQDKLAVMYHSADAIKSYLYGEKNPSVNENDDDEEFGDDTDSPNYLLGKKSDLDREISRYSKFVERFIPYLDKLDQGDIITYFQPEGNFTIDGFKQFLTKSEEETPVDYFNKLNQNGEWTYRSVFDGLVNPRKMGFFVKYRSKIGSNLIDDIEDILYDVFDLSNNIYVKKKQIDKIENAIQDKKEKQQPIDDIKPDTGVSKDDLNFDDVLEEVTLPVKGLNVDSQNKSNANKENAESTKDAEKSQETTEEKVDNLKNQKHIKNSWEEQVDETLHGWRNNLDLDYKTGLDKDQAKRIKDQASGVAPKDHANVDHESKSGEKLINAAKTRSSDEFINKDDYTSKHDRTQIEKGQNYEKTTVFDELDENTNKYIDRLKMLFAYEEKLVNENRNNAVNENDLLFKQVTKKKFI